MDLNTASEGDIQLVTLGIGEEIFAVPVDAVLEILDMRPMFRLPESPAYLAGLIDVRGRAVPVIDLRTKLGLPTLDTTENTRVLVLDVRVGERKLVLGLIADRVFEVAALGAEQIEPAPEIGVPWRSDYILGVGRRNESFVIIFDLSRLFTAEEAAYLGAKATSAVTSADAEAPVQPAGDTGIPSHGTL